MSDLTVEYALSDAYRQAQFVATGKLPPATAAKQFLTDGMTPEQRTVVAAYCGTTLDTHLYEVGYNQQLTVFDAIPNLEMILAAMQRILAERRAKRVRELQAKIVHGTAALRRNIEQHDPVITRNSSYDLWPEQADEADALGLDTSEWRSLAAEIEAHTAEWQAERQVAEERQRAADAAWKVREAERQERAAAEIEARKAQFAADKAAWVAAHGSAYLKRACGGGYDCTRLYVTERAAVEAPGFAVDFDDTSAWKERSCPSELSLDIVDAVPAGLEATVVWLTAPVQSKNDMAAYDFEACEAVVIRHYLGKYDLVRII